MQDTYYTHAHTHTLARIHAAYEHWHDVKTSEIQADRLERNVLIHFITYLYGKLTVIDERTNQSIDLMLLFASLLLVCFI